MLIVYLVEKQEKLQLKSRAIEDEEDVCYILNYIDQ